MLRIGARAWYNRRMKRKLVCIAIVLVAFALALTACDADRYTLTYRDEVLARYYDGIAVSETFSAPVTAIEYTDTKRIEQTMQIDNRIAGEHFTGVYVPRGETLSVTVPKSVVEDGHRVLVRPIAAASNSSDRIQSQYEYACDKTQFKIDPIKDYGLEMLGYGCMIYLDIAPSARDQEAFEIKLRGGIRAPYYRLGVDSEKEFVAAKPVARASIDTGNVRFDLGADAVSRLDADTLFDAMLWWRSCVEQLNAITGCGSAVNDYAPIAVDVRDGYDTCYYDANARCVKMPTQIFLADTDPQRLYETGGTDLLRALCELRVRQSDGFVKEDWDAMQIVGAIEAAIKIEMTDDAVDPYTDGQSTASAVWLEKTLNREWESDRLLTGLIGNLTYTYGRFKTQELFEAYRYFDRENAQEKLLLAASEVLGCDLSDYAELFGDQPVSDAVREEMSRYPKYPTVQNRYTAGGVDRGNVVGTRVLLGKQTEFDFASAIVAQDPDRWSVREVRGTQGLWTKQDDGTYLYMPSENLLRDRYELVLTDGQSDVVLYGYITVDVHSASYSVYHNVAFRDMDTAIKHYKNLEVSEYTAVDHAGTPEFGAEDTVETQYSFSILRGSIQVEETGIYTFYLRSRGFCRVMFGVPDYKYELFDNFLTVLHYTEELKQEVELEQDKVYSFEIYLLNVTGLQMAHLGMREPDDEESVTDLTAPYLYADGMRAEREQKYMPPIHPIHGYDEHGAEFSDYTADVWTVDRVEPELSATATATIKALFDRDRETAFESGRKAERFAFDIDMKASNHLEYFTLSCGVDMARDGNVQLGLEISADGETYAPCATQMLEKVDTTVRFAQPVIGRYLRIVLTSDSAFACKLWGIATGKAVGQSKIIPNTSTMLEYQGEWRECRDYAAINGIVTENNDRNCALSLKFYGSEISLYATKAAKYGVANIYLDGKDLGLIDLNSDTTVCSQRVFYHSMDPGLHNLRIVPVDTDLINVDYFSYVPSPEVEPEPETRNLYFMLIIPGVALIGLIASLILDALNKRRRDDARRMKQRKPAPSAPPADGGAPQA